MSKSLPNRPLESVYLPYTLMKNTTASVIMQSNEDRFVAPQTEITYEIDNNLKNYIPADKLPFKHLFTFNTNTEHASNSSFYLGIGYITYNFTRARQTPIDMVVNRSALTTISNFYNAQQKSFNYNYPENTGTATVEQILKNENIYYIIKFLRFFDNFALNSIKITQTSQASKFYQLYNDKVSTGDYFCEYIYRARPVRRDFNFHVERTSDTRLYYINESGSGDFAKIPVFRVITTDQYLQFYIVIRNFKIPMKKICTSSNTYIFLCPEYILKQYSEHVDAISYIIANHRLDVEYSMMYDYLYTDDDNHGHLWAHNRTNNVYDNYGIKLGNTNSNISFTE